MRSREGVALLVALGSGCSVLAPSDAEVFGGGVASNDAGRASGASGAGAAGEPGAGGSELRGGSAGSSAVSGGGSAAPAGGAAAEGGSGGAGDGGAAAGGTTSSAGGDSGTGGAPDDAGAGGDAQAGAPPSVPGDGLVLWLDAERGAQTDEQGRVSEWADQSGRGNGAAQPAASSRPRRLEDGIGARPALAFDGANDFLALPAGFGDFASGLSFFAVARLYSEASCPALLELSNADADAIGFLRYFDRFEYRVAADYARGPEASFASGATHLFAVVHSVAGLATLYRDRVAVGSHAGMALPAVVARTDNRIASSRATDGDGAPCLPFEGLLGEMLLYERELEPDERRDVEAYLAGRWSFASP